jgi:hypothetical protein
MSKIIKIEQADGGYIISVIKGGESILREPYEREKVVISGDNLLAAWLRGFFERNKA